MTTLGQSTFRYGLVSGLCLVVHNAIMIGGDRLGLVMPASVGISFVTVVLIGFVLHSRYTFAVTRGAGSLLRYTVAMAANVPLTLVLLWLFTAVLHWPMTVASPVATLVLIVINFFASRWAITSPRSEIAA